MVNNLKSGNIVSVFTIIAKNVNSAWIEDFDKGIINTSDGNTEITTIPFANDEIPRPNATGGLFISS